MPPTSPRASPTASPRSLHAQAQWQCSMPNRHMTYTPCTPLSVFVQAQPFNPSTLAHLNHSGVGRYMRYGRSTRALASVITGKYSAGNTCGAIHNNQLVCTLQVPSTHQRWQLCTLHFFSGCCMNWRRRLPQQCHLTKTSTLHAALLYVSRKWTQNADHDGAYISTGHVVCIIHRLTRSHSSGPMLRTASPITCTAKALVGVSHAVTQRSCPCQAECQSAWPQCSLLVCQAVQQGDHACSRVAC